MVRSDFGIAGALPGFEYADEITRSGGRILTAKQVAERAEQARYDAQPAINKVAGAAATVAGAVRKYLLLRRGKKLHHLLEIIS